MKALKNNIKKYSDILILIIIWGVSIYSVFKVVSQNYVIGIQNYIGYGLLILVTVLRFANYSRFKIFFGVFLFAGTLNFIGVTYMKLVFYVIFFKRIAGDLIRLEFQPLFLILLLYFVFSNMTTIVKFLHSGKQSKSDEIEGFYEKLKNHSDEELNKIIEAGSSNQEELLIAAKIVVRERKNK